MSSGLLVSGGGAGALVFVLLILGLYFLPLIIAVARKVPNVGSVAVVNIFLGWTFIGWIVALAMSARSVQPAQQVNVYAHTQRPQQQFYAPPTTTYPTSPPQAATAAPGWYTDPIDRSRLRYFDGANWTDHLS